LLWALSGIGCGKLVAGHGIADSRAAYGCAGNACGRRLIPALRVQSRANPNRRFARSTGCSANQSRTDFKFVLVPTAPKRRYGNFQQQRIDLAIFENPRGGWQAIEHVALDMQLEDAGVFVARTKPGRDQHYVGTL
jgi:hypothetical protein